MSLTNTSYSLRLTILYLSIDYLIGAVSRDSCSPIGSAVTVSHRLISVGFGSAYEQKAHGFGPGFSSHHLASNKHINVMSSCLHIK